MTIKSGFPPDPPPSLALSEIQSEFGGVNPISLSEYYTGGYVPAGTSGIPTEGAISIRQFYGKTSLPNPISARVLIVGGGGGGGVKYNTDNDASNGGGGAGGYIDVNVDISRGSYDIGIGGGGWFGSTWDRDTISGGNTSAFGYTAIGGGGGGGSDLRPGLNGGSGGGAARGPGGSFNYDAPGKGTSGQGNDGFCGGGGSGAAGGVHDGGAGTTWIDGNTYCGGGGDSLGAGGSGGGGGTSGYYTYDFVGYDGYGNSVRETVWHGNNLNSGNPATYYGGGGQGGTVNKYLSFWDPASWGGAGYQGIVIVSYVWPFQLMTGGTVSGDANRWYHSITSSGTLTY